MFNVPTVVIAVLGALLLVHALHRWILPPEGEAWFLLWFAFIPARYEASELALGGPEGLGPQIWTFVSYALIHGNLLHLGVNTVWFLPFGSAVARRFGAARFLVFFAVTAAAGAALHLATRFAFQDGGPLGSWRAHETHAYHVPAAPLRVALTQFNVVMFLVVWFGLNIVLGLFGSLSMGGEDQEIAWQAHIGGFLAGFSCFPGSIR